MIYKIGVLGATGRMGLEVAALIEENPTLELGDAVASSKRLTSVDGVPVRELSEPAWEPVHAWIDFSRPEATLKLLEHIRTPVVIATTGFTEEGLGTIRKYAKSHPVVFSSNMSPGMNLFQRLMEELPSGAPGFDVVMDESHHRHKKDAPSGTGKALLGLLAQRGIKHPTVHVTRAGGLPGDHVVRLIAEEEELVLTHRVWDRKVFARGAVEALLFLLKHNKPGLYTMRDVFEGGD